jgi:hypothetical protein
MTACKTACGTSIRSLNPWKIDGRNASQLRRGCCTCSVQASHNSDNPICFLHNPSLPALHHTRLPNQPLLHAQSSQLSKRQNCTAHDKIVLHVLCLCIITLPLMIPLLKNAAPWQLPGPQSAHRNMHSPFVLSKLSTNAVRAKPPRGDALRSHNLTQQRYSAGHLMSFSDRKQVEDAGNMHQKGASLSAAHIYMASIAAAAKQQTEQAARGPNGLTLCSDNSTEHSASISCTCLPAACYTSNTHKARCTTQPRQPLCNTKGVLRISC